MNNRHLGYTVALTAAATSTLLGATVLYGWFSRNLILLHIRPNWVAMAFNTALGFLLSGISLIGLITNRQRIAIIGGVFGIVFGTLTLIEYATGVNTRVDELFLHTYTRAGVTNPARMAFCTAICFLLVGAVSLLAQRADDALACRRRVLFTAIAGATISSLGLIALSGYFTGVSITYTWGQLTRMAVHTALGFIVLGAGVIGFATVENTRLKRGEPLDLLPAIVGIAAATATLCLWQALIVANRAQYALIRGIEMTHADVRLSLIGRTQAILTAGALATGLLLAVLLSVAVSLARTARHRSEKLAAEVVERERAQAELQAATDELEDRVDARTSELAGANKELEEAHRQIKESAEKQRTFLRDVLASVTEGRLRLCTSMDDLPKPYVPFKGLIELSREDISALRDLALSASNKAGLPDDRACDLITSVGEAAMNAVVHGGGGKGWVYIDPGTAVQVWVADHGSGIEMSSLHQATLRRGFTTTGSFGHGFWMMLNTVDTVWLLTGPTGTTIVMEQRKVPLDPFWMTMGT